MCCILLNTQCKWTKKKIATTTIIIRDKTGAYRYTAGCFCCCYPPLNYTKTIDVNPLHYITLHSSGCNIGVYRSRKPRKLYDENWLVSCIFAYPFHKSNRISIKLLFAELCILNHTTGFVATSCILMCSVHGSDRILYKLCESDPPLSTHYTPLTPTIASANVFNHRASISIYENHIISLKRKYLQEHCVYCSIQCLCTLTLYTLLGLCVG